MRIFQPKFSLKREGDILRKLAMYVSAQLPLSDALQLLADETQRKKEKKTLLMWRIDIEEGKSLSAAFGRLETLQVSKIAQVSIMIGEKSEALSQSLKTASEHIEKVLEIKKKVIGALAYPALVFLGTIGLVLGLLLFVFPKIIPLFVTLKVSLPLSTRILIAFTHTLQSHWLMISLGLCAGIGVITTLYAFSVFFKNACHFGLVRIPFIGNIFKIRLVANMFDSLFTLVHGGESLDVALVKVSEIVHFSEYKTAFCIAGQMVKEGKPLGIFFKERKKLFPSFIPGLISVGERTGNMEDSIRDVAKILSSELDDTLRVLTGALEPILMVSMSLLIGFIAISIILPIYGITSHFQNV